MALIFWISARSCGSGACARATLHAARKARETIVFFKIRIRAPLISQRKWQKVKRMLRFMQRGLSADADMSSRAEMMIEHPVNLRKFCIPLVPVMASGHDMKFVLEPSFAHEGGKFFVRRQQPFRVATREKKVWSLCDVRGAREHIGVVVVLELTIPGAKDGPETTPL